VLEIDARGVVSAMAISELFRKYFLDRIHSVLQRVRPLFFLRYPHRNSIHPAIYGVSALQLLFGKCTGRWYLAYKLARFVRKQLST
jgi:hypothetical protein